MKTLKKIGLAAGGVVVFIVGAGTIGPMINKTPEYHPAVILTSPTPTPTPVPTLVPATKARPLSNAQTVPQTVATPKPVVFPAIPTAQVYYPPTATPVPTPAVSNPNDGWNRWK